MEEYKVVIIDDHSILRDGLKRILEREEGFVVVGDVGSARKGLEIIQQTRADVVVLDLSLPDGSGLDLITEIFREAPDIKIIVLTMHDNENYVIEAMEKGIHGYLLKSSAGEYFTRAIRAVVLGETFISPELSGLLIKSLLHKDKRDEEREKLTYREREILRLVAEGKTNEEIGSLLYISPRTVETHRRNIRKKLKLDSTASLIRYAIKHGIISEEN